MTVISKIDEVLCNTDGLSVVIFDLDDTLYSEKQYVKSGYCAIAKKFPQIVDFETKLWTAFENKKPAIDEVLKNEGLFSEKNKQECMQTYRLQIPTINLYDGVKEMLSRLHKSDYKIGIITDGRPEGQINKINSLNLKKYVDHIIITDELGGIDFRKPNETAFVMMQRYFQCPFKEMCYVGDNIKKDFIAPDKLGMKSIYFKNKDGLYFN